MSRRFSLFVSWGCLAIILFTTAAMIWFLFNIDGFANLAKSNVVLLIVWSTVEQWQWYVLWVISLLNILIGLVGLYYLHRAFAKFAQGELFNLMNSTNIRRFSVLLFVQVLAKPLYHSLSSVVLSWNHGPGEKILSVSFGSQEIVTLGLAMVLWVISDLLISGSKLQTENKQFI